MVQAVADWIRKYGLPLTSRGWGKPARPPTVWTKRTESSRTSGSDRRTSNATPGIVMSFTPKLKVVEPTSPAALMPVADDLAVLDLDPGPELVRLAKAVRVTQPLEITLGQLLGRRVVVVPDPDLERELGHARDRLGRNPRDRSYRRLDAHGTSSVWHRKR